MRTSWILLILISLLFAGCSALLPRSKAVPAPPKLQSPPLEEVAVNTPENPLKSGNTRSPEEMSLTAPPVEKFVNLAKKDLAGRLQINMDGISLVKTAEMLWPNVALGCPSPGRVYPTKKVPGYQISLTANNVEYVYNTDWVGQVILCLKQGPDGSLEPVTTVGPEIGVPIK